MTRWTGWTAVALFGSAAGLTCILFLLMLLVGVLTVYDLGLFLAIILP